MNSLIERAYALATVPTINQPTTGAASIPALVQIVLTWIVWIAGVAAFIYLVYSGILYISAAGNPDQAKKGQQGIINAVIGIIIVALAYVIINVVNSAATGTTGPS